MKTRTFFIVMAILIGVVIAAHVHYLNMHTWHYPFSFKIDNVEMRQIAFGADSSSTKKYILAIKLRDCDVRTVNYSMSGYPNGIKDSVKQITIIDKNGSDITNSFDCVVVDRKSWQNEESELDHEYNWTKVSNLKNILNSIRGDITLFEEHNDSTRWINAVYTIDSHVVPQKLTFELEHRSLKCEIKDLQQQKRKEDESQTTFMLPFSRHLDTLRCSHDACFPPPYRRGNLLGACCFYPYWRSPWL